MEHNIPKEEWSTIAHNIAMYSLDRTTTSSVNLKSYIKTYTEIITTLAQTQNHHNVKD